MNPKVNATTLGLAAVVLVFVAFVFALANGGFFQFKGDDPSSKVVAAALTLVGAVIAALVSIIGLILKQSLDQSSERRLELEGKRIANLQREAEDRLKLEAAIQAVQLLSTSSGQPAPEIQRAGALFTLSSLHQHELTLSLLTGLLDDQLVSPSIASSLLDLALAEEKHRDAAVNLFADYAEKLVEMDAIHLPNRLALGDIILSPYARAWTAIGIGRMLLARPLSKWLEGKYIYQAGGLIAAVAVSCCRGREERTNHDAEGILREILLGFPDVGVLAHPRMDVDTVPLREKIQNAAPTGSASIEVINQLAKWRTAERSAAPVGDAGIRTEPHIVLPNAERSMP